VFGWRRLVLWPLALMVRLWGRTLRFETTPEDYRAFTKKDEPVAIVLWHNRLFSRPRLPVATGRVGGPPPW
jgi:lysophospholipid acyltransferase (LPLAT)-like uncharacterized protein